MGVLNEVFPGHLDLHLNLDAYCAGLDQATLHAFETGRRAVHVPEQAGVHSLWMACVLIAILAPYLATDMRELGWVGWCGWVSLHQELCALC